MNGHDHLLGPLTDIVRSAGSADADVTITGVASVGATRATVFIDIASGDDTVSAVAQIGSAENSAAGLHEAELLDLARSAGVPVAEVVAASDRLDGKEADVLITTRIEGLSIPREILRSVPDEAAGDVLAEQCGAALAAVHRVPVDSLPSALEHLDEAAPHEDYCHGLEAQLDNLPTPYPATRWGLNWLRRNPPTRPEASTLVHADFRNGNMLVHEGQLAAVLDWELAHVGDPMEDLAWICLRMWRFGNDNRPCGGFGSIAALRRGYESAGGVWRQDAFDWWLAARSAWWAIGLARQGAAFQSGQSTSIVHAASGRRVAELEYDLLHLIRTREN